MNFSQLHSKPIERNDANLRLQDTIVISCARKQPRRSELLTVTADFCVQSLPEHVEVSKAIFSRFTHLKAW